MKFVNNRTLIRQMKFKLIYLIPRMSGDEILQIIESYEGIIKQAIIFDNGIMKYFAEFSNSDTIIKLLQLICNDNFYKFIFEHRTYSFRNAYTFFRNLFKRAYSDSEFLKNDLEKICKFIFCNQDLKEKLKQIYKKGRYKNIKMTDIIKNICDTPE